MKTTRPIRTPEPNSLIGAPLISSAAIAEQYAKAIEALVRAMVRETHAELKAMFNAPGYALDATSLRHIKDGNPTGRAKIIISKLQKKYSKAFADLAAKSTDRMVKKTIKHVDMTAGLSLKDMSENFVLKDMWSPRLNQIVQASTQEAAQLIKTLPEQFLSQVQGATMRSITTGRGLADLTPFLTEKYGQNVRKARSVALDQTRKAYSSLAAQRMQDAGVKKFIWKHSHGGHTPRPQHEAWDGQTFRYDDPPVDDKFGPCLPGQAISCRCFARPVLSFGDDE